MRRVAASALAFAIAGCGGFQPLGSADLAAPPGSDLAAPPGSDLAGLGGDDLAQSQGGGQGPGPWGALPSGYCCTSDADCRYRHCAAVAGTMMCSDECDDDGGCDAVAGLTCVGATQFDSGQCAPAAMSFTCTPAAQYHYGAKKLGACCVATHDGHAGQECEGGRCDASGSDSNPYICTNVCNNPPDCPGNFFCMPIGAFSVCVPDDDPYTCS